MLFANFSKKLVPVMFGKSKAALTVVLSLLIISVSKITAQNTSPVVKTHAGFVRGLVENSIDVFKGIPYAAPPVGTLRFKPPVVHVAWSDTLSTQTFGSNATQGGGKNVTGSEDCLSLNVYTPATDHAKRPVLVWVHGGSMTAGAGRGQDGHAFADQDGIVTVTINYRLGVFGFMYLGDVDKAYATSGNNGVQDVIMALAWIKQNIASFGGDPDQVTLMGESAGAKLISAVLVAPKSKGLFRQYIAESGSVQCIRDTVTAKNARARILRQLGLTVNDAAKLITMPADSLIKAQAAVCAGLGGNSFFGPVDDGKIINSDPYSYAANKKFPHIKALIGTNKSEAGAFISKSLAANPIDTSVFKSLFADDYLYVYKTYQQELKTTTPYEAAIKTFTQYMYQMHSYRFAKSLSQAGVPVWMYRFDFDKSPIGAAHAMELQFVWFDGKIADPEKKQLATEMHSAWVAFIKTGNPNIAPLPLWPNYKDNDRKVLIFNTINKVIDLPEVFDDKDFPSAVFVLKSI